MNNIISAVSEAERVELQDLQTSKKYAVESCSMTFCFLLYRYFNLVKTCILLKVDAFFYSILIFSAIAC